MSERSGRLADLTPQQRELLLLRLRKKQKSPPPAPQALGKIEPRPAETGPLPLSFSQQRLWFLDQWAPGSSQYNITTALVAEGELDAAALGRALDEIVRRHESLRTRFDGAGIQPVQVVDLPAPGTWPVVDLTALAAARREAEARRRGRELLLHPFDLCRGRLLRVGLLRTTGSEHVLVLAMHHIVSDGWSMGILVRELVALYQAGRAGAAAAPLPELAIQYPDFALWQRRWLADERLTAHLDYWRRQLDGIPAMLELPSDRPRPAEQSFTGSRCARQLGAELSEALAACARQSGVTLFTWVLAAFDTLLARTTGQTDVVVGSPIAHRNRAETEGLIGFFVNTLVLRLDLSGRELSFSQLLARARETLRGAFEHQDVPFEKLVEELRPERQASHNPIFQIMLAMQDTPRTAVELPGLALRPLEMELDTAMFDLTVTVGEGAAGLAVAFEYNADLFDATTLERFGRHFGRLLEGIVADPQQPISKLPLFAAAERAQVVREWNPTASLYPRGPTLAGLVAAQASRAPDRTALCRAGARLSYGELAARVHRLARHLLAVGVEREDVVGLCLERGLDLPVAMLAVLEAGAAYLPLDPTYPRERLAFVVEDARSPVIVTTQALAGRLPRPAAGRTVRRVSMDRDAEEIARRPPKPPPGEPVHPDQLAYLIYTSGSTGRPKGVAITHRSAVTLVYWAAETFPAEALDAVLAATSINFDLSVFEIFAPLCRGGRVILAENALELPELAEKDEVRLVNTVPSAIAELVRKGELGAAVRWVNLAGEALRRALVEEIYAAAGVAEVWNLYGPSEDTTYSTAARVPRGAAAEPTIGRPLADTRAHVLDAEARPVPPGVVGELCLGGRGLARGYFDRPGLTAERFVPDPLAAQAPGNRLYRTGDLARWRGDGELLFLGRADHQVKLRGFRIELGEIEALLSTHPALAQAAVIVRDAGPGSDRRLVACFVPAAGAGPERAELRGFLRERLPDYMVPGTYAELEALPLTPSGKVDRRALGALAVPDREADDTVRAAPRTPLEEQLALIWADVLGVRQVGVDDDFFDLGGHSLLATQVASRLRRDLDVELPVRLLFEAPTLAELAAAVEALRRRAAGTELPPIVAAPRDSTASSARQEPLSFAQQRLWFLDRLDGDNTAYNLPAGLLLEGRLEVAALAAALDSLVARHETLRTTFASPGERPVQVISPADPVRRHPLPIVDLAGLPAAPRAGEARRLAELDARSPFDLERGPLFRTLLVRLRAEPGEHLALCNMHHIVSDGWSMAILVRELGAFYRALVSGDEAHLPELPVQYADFAVWQRRHLSELFERQLEYWRGTLADAPEMLELATDRPRPPVKSFRGAFEQALLPAALAAALEELGRRHGATLFMTLLAGFATLLGRTSHQRDLVVGSPIANRNRLETEGLIGFFVNTLALRLDLSADRRTGAASFQELLSRARRVTLEAYAHQDLPFERLVEELVGRRSLARTPLFQVMLAVQNTPAEALELPGLTLRPAEVESATAKFDLTLIATEIGEAGGDPALESPLPVSPLDLALEYDTDLFDRVSMRRFLHHFRTLLAAVSSSPEEPLERLGLLGPAERQALLRERNDSTSDYPRSSTVTELFEATAAAAPDRAALRRAESVTSYAELHRRAERRARVLRSCGVGPEVPVGLCLERDDEMVVTSLAILKAGGVYVPLDPEQPRERLAFMLEDTGARVVLVGESLRAVLPESLPGIRLISPGDRGPRSAADGLSPAAPATERSLAYVMYTSGSTGRPKGIAVTHRNIVRLVKGTDYVELGPGDRVAQAANTAFDAATFEIWGALLNGASVVLVPRAVTLDARRLAEEIRLRRLTAMFLTTALFHQVVREEPTAFAPLGHLLFGGETVDPVRVRELLAGAPPRRLLHVYGPTESTTFTTWYEIMSVAPGAAAVPIGGPLANTRVHVLDRRGGPVPMGVTGQLAIGGDGLARGYLNRPRLTAEAMDPDPFSPSPGARLYFTGDLVRRQGDGAVVFLGRIDQQVKIRGFRIEPGEVEASMGELAAVRQAAVVVRDEPGIGKLLVAYYVAAPDAAAGARPELRAELAERLPAYMVPAAFVELDHLPLNPNGKIDRRRLPEPQWQRDEDVYVAPRTPAEEILAGIFADVLGVERVGVTDDFFELGGHSLVATRLMARVRAAFEVDLALARLFEAPTVAALAEDLRAARQVLAIPPPAPVARGGELALSFAQERLWFLDRMEPASAAYNIATAVYLDGELSVAALDATLAELVRRHETLSTRFAERRGWPVQVIEPAAGVVLGSIDLTALGEATRQRELRHLAAAEAARPFDLSHAPLLRTSLVRLAAERHAVLLTMHHVVSDGLSMGILIHELGTLYTAFCRGKPSPLEPLPVQYADYAAWQRRYLSGEELERQLAWWRECLQGAPALLELPADRPRPAVRTARGGLLAERLPAALARGVAALALRSGATVYMTLLAAFESFLARLTHCRDLVLGGIVAGRDRPEVSGLIGFFVNTLVLRTDFSGEPSFAALLARVKAVNLGAWEHQDVPFEKLVGELSPARSLNRAPLVQVVFQHLRTPPRLELPGLELTPLEVESRTAKFDLVVNMTGAPEGLVGVWRYSTDLFDASTVGRWQRSFRALVEDALADPARRVSELALLEPGARHQLLSEWGPGPWEESAEPAQRVFGQWAREVPRRIAAVSGTGHLSYAELDRRASRLAGALLVGQAPPADPARPASPDESAGGACPTARTGNVVALLADRGLDFLAAMLGVWKAGGAYLPLDPQHPPQRLAQVLAQSAARLVLVARGFEDAIADALDLVTDGERPAVAGLEQALAGTADETSLPPPARPSDLAYVIYTSGSTGVPKGAMVAHRGLSNHLRAKITELGMSAADSVAQTASQCFDISVWQFVAPLLVGGRVRIYGDATAHNPMLLADRLEEDRISILETVPSLMRLVLGDLVRRGGRRPGLERLRWLIPTGEALPPELARRWLEHYPRVPLLNAYGPTECSDDVTHHALCRPPEPSAVRVAIGHPLVNLEIYVVDARLCPVPAGAVGELVVAGAGVGRGYLRDPRRTADVFVPDSLGPRSGERLYRTADLARFLPGGILDFLGRRDHQVKVRGFRIELGEIEAGLTKHPSVAEAVVLARGERAADRLLAAYVVTRGAEELSLGEIREFLSDSLPDYMLPSALVALEAMPLSANGKVDRKRLPEPEPAPESGRRREFVAPRTPVERYLADLWRETLELDATAPIGIADDFFEIGGNSIRGAVLINRLQQELEEIVHVVTLFDAPALGELAAYVEREHPRAVTRLFGAAARAPEAGRRSKVDAARLDELRRRISPLPPAPPGPRNPPAIFVLAPPRSGTTLLRVMLAGHPELFAPPELELLSFNTLEERAAALSGRFAFYLEGLVRALMELHGTDAESARAIVDRAAAEGTSTRAFYGHLQSRLAAREGAEGRARRLVDKTPSYSLDPEILKRAERDFDGAFYVHLVRHPCAVIHSFAEAKLDQVFFRWEHSFERRELAELVWHAAHRNITAFLEGVPPERQLRIGFEDLVRDPHATIEKLCGALGLDFDPRMVDPYEDPAARMTDGLHAESRMVGDVKFHQHRQIEAGVAGRWREHMSEDLLGEVTWELAESLGYERSRGDRVPGDRALEAIEPRPRGGAPVPLSFSQQRLWFLDQWSPGGSSYHVPSALVAKGEISVATLRRTLDEIVRRHEALRTRFEGHETQPVQVVDPPVPGTWPLVDLSALAPARREAEARRHAREMLLGPFDLARGPLLRVGLVRLARRGHLLALAMHHIVSDGWSMGVLIHELVTLYRAFREGAAVSPLPELAVQYPDFALWQRRRLTGERLAAHLDYWRRQLDGAPAACELPYDRPRPAEQSFDGAQHSCLLADELAEALDAGARQHGVTLFMLVLAAFDTLLYRTTGQTDVVVGSPIAGRDRAEIERLIGFFVNTLILRLDLSGRRLSFSQLLDRARRTVRDAFAHQDVPFEKLVEELRPERRTNHNPFFQVVLALADTPHGAIELPGLELLPFAMELDTAKFDLTVSIGARSAGLAITFEYSTDLFDATTVRRLARRFTRLLEVLPAHTETAVSELDLLHRSECHQLLCAWNDTAAAFPSSSTVAELFEAQAALAPAAVALRAGDSATSYGELNRQANQLAHYLRSRAVAPEVPVGFCLERSAEMVVATLAVVKAGGFYVPLDPEHPPERLAFMLADTRAPLVLIREPLAAALPESLTATRSISLGKERERIARHSGNDPAPVAAAHNPAYVMYTSGSTGRPKGIAVTHRNIVRLVKGTDYVELGPDDRVAQAANTAFDAATFEIWGALLNGASVVLVPREVTLDARRLAEEVRLRRLTAMFLTTALFQQVARQESTAFAALRHLLFGGETVDPARVRELLAGAAPRRLLHVYGPTESTTFATWQRVREVARGAKTVAIGRPLANTLVTVADRELEPVPIGVAGELLIGGDGLARGYFGRPALTAERFVPDALTGRAPEGRCGARLYATGDLVRRLADGALEFLGRIDHQVKIRGFRIEPGEIEVVLSACPALAQAAVVVRDDGPGGERRLVAYVVAQPGAPAHEAELRGFLRDKLPDYMVPGTWVVLEALPLTPNGKVDRRALPAPARRAEKELRTAPASRTVPRTPLEEQLALVWESVLDVRGVGVDDDFFELGGHSLSATRVVSRLRRDLDVELPVRLVFEASTLGELAAEVEALQRRDAGTELPPIVPVSRDGDEALPPSFAQQRLWFLDRLEEGNTAYNVPAGFRLEGRLDAAAYAAAVARLVARHESLRTTFASPGGRPVQVIARRGSAARRHPLPVVDLAALPAAVREDEARRLAALDARSTFDLERGPLFRTLLLRLAAETAPSGGIRGGITGPGEHLALFNMHHIISDGWSMGILVREVAACYQALVSGAADPLPALPIQYADFAVWQRRHLSDVLERQLEYWRGELEGAPEVLELATDRPRQAVRSFRGAVEQAFLPRPLASALGDLGRHHGTTLFMTFLAAFAHLAERYSHQRDVVVGSPIAGRNRLETEGLIGFFVNTLVLRLDLAGEPSFTELLGRAREITLAAYAHQDLPFERLVEELQPARSFAHSPLFQVMLILQNAPQEALELPGLTLRPVAPDTGTAKFDLTLAVAEGSIEDDTAAVGLALEYATDLFDRVTARRILGHFRTLLEAITCSPEVPVSRIALLARAERQQLCREWNDTAAADRRAPLVPDLVAARAAERPDAVAVVLARQGQPPTELRYAELERRSGQLARTLRERGVGPEVAVGVCLERSLNLVVAVLGVWKAGGAYVPLDPSYPRERLLWLLEDSGSRVLVTEESLLAQSALDELPEEAPELLVLDHCVEPAQGGGPEPATSPLQKPTRPKPTRPDVSPWNRAYVIYTSGSTGRPKGVEITHRNCLALTEWAAEAFTDQELEAVLASTSISFDLSVFELFVTLSRGGRVILVDDALGLASLPADTEVSLVNTVPSALTELLASGGVPRSVETINLAGEAWPAGLAGEIHRRTGVRRLLNLYGPSEDTTYSTIAEVRRGFEGSPPIGVPIGRTRAHVVDRHLRPTQIGVPGELCLGGAGLARGYLRRPALTAEKFVPDLIHPVAGSRLYRTGDLARRGATGELAFLGRIDHQVKVRGFRIELGEIETALAHHEAVRQAVVLARQDRPGDQRLVAYLIAAAGETAPSVGELRRFLAQTLPEYMVPSVFVELDELPLTANGKVDRRRLPVPEAGRPELEAAYLAASGPVEEALVAIWSEVLGVEKIGVHDNFFELGGHSLLATQIVSRAFETFQVEISLRRFFAEPTVAALAELVRETQLEEADEAEEEMFDLIEGLSDEELAAKLEELRSAG